MKFFSVLKRIPMHVIPRLRLGRWWHLLRDDVKETFDTARVGVVGVFVGGLRLVDAVMAGAVGGVVVQNHWGLDIGSPLKIAFTLSVVALFSIWKDHILTDYEAWVDKMAFFGPVEPEDIRLKRLVREAIQEERQAELIGSPDPPLG